MDRVNVIVTLAFVLLSGYVELCAARSFTIDYVNNTFVKDGQPFRYISGSMHYGRVHHLYWQDRLKKMYMAGLDAVQTYVPWNLHEPKQGTFNFNGTADIETFLKTAQANGLLVILRAGPYICAEWDMGGLPSWLLKDHDIQLRTSDPAYLKYVDLWMAVLLPKIKPFLYAFGGPIITVQIENEYGSYPACDHLYMRHLLHLFRSHLGDDVIYFSTDGPGDKDLKCGTLQGIYTTVDFGISNHTSNYFEEQRKFQPQGPLVNSEYYTGWLDHWGMKHQTRPTPEVVQHLDEILHLGANVNMYMFEGGTNFAYWNGANGNEKVYLPQPTSYDYDSPLTEAGDPNEKYQAIRTLIGKYKTLPPGEIPPATPKYAYGKTTMIRMSTLYQALKDIAPGGPVLSDYPISMEDMDQNFGFMLYRTKLKANYTTPTLLNVTGIRDRGYVLVNQTPVAILKRNLQPTITIMGLENSTLDILVENTGRLNYGCCINDSKGIISNVTLGGVILTSWQIYSLDLEKALPPSAGFDSAGIRPTVLGQNETPDVLQVPSFFVGILPSKVGDPADTFLKMTGWSKGQAFINGFNLGRYWPTDGPQITLYVPAVVLKKTANTLVLFETECSPCQASDPTATCTVEFVDKPILNSTIPPSGGEVVKLSKLEESEAEAYDSWEEMLNIAEGGVSDSEKSIPKQVDADFDMHSSHHQSIQASSFEKEDVEEKFFLLKQAADKSESPKPDSVAEGDGDHDGTEEKDGDEKVKEIAAALIKVVYLFTALPAAVWNFFLP